MEEEIAQMYASADERRIVAITLSCAAGIYWGNVSMCPRFRAGWVSNSSSVALEPKRIFP